MASTPTIITPAAAAPVSLPDLKEHLRVRHDDDDAQIEAMGWAAVAHLDGWSGLLGRAIMLQTWEERFAGPGPYRLSLPDVLTTTITADGEVVTGTVSHEARGPVVTLDGCPSEVVIQYEAALPERLLPAAQAAVKLYVEHLWGGTDLSPGFAALVSVLRWRRF